jgi:DNA-binding GntR family transcriptional regulator
LNAPGRTTRADRLAEQIADAILTGEYRPGARLDEQGLADRFDVSRTPVREALRLLGATGLIDLRPRRGAVVVSMTSGQIFELFVAMGEIEATCARLSALSMSPIERRRLQVLHESMSEMAQAEDTTAYVDANILFHTTIYLGSHNAVIAEFAGSLRRRLQPFRRAQFRAPGRTLLSHSEHEAVVSAILNGDAARAHEAMLRHVNFVEDAFEQVSASFGHAIPGLMASNR